MMFQRHRAMKVCLRVLKCLDCLLALYIVVIRTSVVNAKSAPPRWGMCACTNTLKMLGASLCHGCNLIIINAASAAFATAWHEGSTSSTRCQSC